jgi:hypothetical protein
MTYLRPNIAFISVAWDIVFALPCELLESWKILISFTKNRVAPFDVWWAIAKIAGNPVLLVNALPLQSPYGGMAHVDHITIGFHVKQKYYDMRIQYKF